jgi:hypothetical protein
MRQKRLKFSAILLLMLGLTGLQAQEAIPATGGEASGSGGRASYSVGQMVYTTNTGSNGSAAQGVQQPYEISVITGIEEAKGINLSVSAYPNPTNDFLTLKVDASTALSIHSLSYQLFDLQGNLLETKKITGNETSIVMSNLVPAIYFLKVYAVGRNGRTGVIQNDKKIKTFKIIKN